MTLELWAQQALEDIGVDGVFAPYIVGMLKPEEAVEDEEEIKFNIHQVLMGWLSPEDEVSHMKDATKK
jgi:hypothetical protein